MFKESNEDDTEETLQTNKQRALTSLQLVYSWVFTCFRFAATFNMLLCLLFCFVSLIQSSSVFPLPHFAPVCAFLVIPCNCSHCENGSFEVLSLQKERDTDTEHMITSQAFIQQNDGYKVASWL